ncbi:uncharacterized protein [Diabrotica undecimpunctata]|uniref:uncharacterized protein n=1 Tax=Diabrotica undecimpunctata TaxID=50387 RepID=UPI003B63808E
MATKAVHLEVATELTTSAFLEVLQRFITRRGKPSAIYSDNGSNFVGANNKLKDLSSFLKCNQSTLQTELGVNQGINWHFIPAYSPHQGGLWEAGVKSVKYHQIRIMYNRLLTFESFYIIVTQIEGILNARPLKPLSSDPNDVNVLTPAHFLIGRPINSIPYPNVEAVSKTMLSHFEQLEQCKQHFWTRYS